MARQSTTTPRGLLSHAVAFSAAAEAVHLSRLDDPLPKYFLWGRTIELALKSFLLAQGRTVTELRSKAFGHDLNALLRDAKARGVSELIGPNAIHSAIVQVLNFDYMSKRYEYRVTRGTYHFPDVTLTRQLVKRLLRGIEFHLKNHQSI